MPQLIVDTPTGPFTLTETDGAITRAGWVGRQHDHTPLLDRAAVQIGEYFAGTRRVFDLPLAADAPPSRRDFLEALLAIPYGQTRTYGDLAAELGLSAQAAGTFCGSNPIAVIIPCHRVLGAGGRMVGYSGGQGVETKVALLKLEGAAGLLI